MKTTATTPRIFALALALLLGAFAAKAQNSAATTWQPDNHYTNTFKAMSQGQTPASFVRAQAADADAVYRFGYEALAFVLTLEEDAALPAAYLQNAVIESGHVHFMPSGKCVEHVDYGYCDYLGYIGNERFGMRQYLYTLGQEVVVLRILHRAGMQLELAFAAAEAQLIERYAPLAVVEE